MKTRNKGLLFLIIVAVIAFLVCAFFVYTADYYRADETAAAALVSDGSVTVRKTDFGWLFDGYSQKDAVVFYPGGKVEASSYAPLCRRLAESGVDVCLVEMPFRLAFFGANKADGVIEAYDYENYYMAGHSLGGVFAAFYASGHAEKLSGVILLAAYSTSPLEEGLKTAVIYGSEDRVLNLDALLDNVGNLPSDTIMHVIAGGNHAMFGSYGVQAGDGEALISSEKQIEETVSVITSLIFG